MFFARLFRDSTSTLIRLTGINALARATSTMTMASTQPDHMGGIGEMNALSDAIAMKLRQMVTQKEALINHLEVVTNHDLCLVSTHKNQTYSKGVYTTFGSLFHPAAP